MKPDNKILYVAVLAASVLLLLIFISQEMGKNQAEPVIIPEKTGSENQTPTPGRAANNYTALIPKNVCEGCHMSGKSSVPQAESAKAHVNGGAYCFSCHVISHEKHPMNNTVSCEKCHGATPGKPVYSNGTISCNNCHDYPDPLLPSKGNLITVHRPRGVTCNSCHTDSCTKCHEELGTTERWNKRNEHFKVVAMGR